LHASDESPFLYIGLI